MKFTDGLWLIRDGVKANFAAQAYSAVVDEKELKILAATRPIRHRGDTLEGPLLTVRLSSPLEDVIRVRVSHYEGGIDRGPHFELEPTEAVGSASLEDGKAFFISGELAAEIELGTGWDLAFTAKGKVVTTSGERSIGYHQVAGEGAFVSCQLGLGVGEQVYGLGERFTPFVKNGQVVDCWNKDGGVGSEQSYKNIPFYLTNRGYGVFVNSPGAVSFEVGSERASRVQFSEQAEALEYFVIYGPTPKEILRKYTALTGRPALPPAWSFGLWLSTSFTTNYDEATVTSFIDGMAERNLPLHVFHFDCFWMKEFEWCNFTWDERVFPEPAAMLTRLKMRGLRVSAWINSYIAQQSPLFEEGKQSGFLLKNADGGVFQTDQWQPGMGLVDFTNPEACEWFKGKLRPILDDGVDALKTDFGERIPINVEYHDRANSVGMHNFYTYLYNKTVFELLKERQAQPVLFARSATVGGQKFPIHWGGDCYSNYESMAESLRGGLSLSLCGFGFWSHDIGGFEGLPPAHIYKRWLAFGLLSSHSRLHGSSSYRVPWLYDDESVDVLRKFTLLKCNLMPYLYRQAMVARDEGIPTMRPMVLEFPDDPACALLDRQYLMGESLLVAPVLSADGHVEFYLPSGRWTHLLTEEVCEGGRWVQANVDFLSMPLYVRENTFLAMGMEKSVPDYDYTEGVRFTVYGLADGGTARAEVPSLTGEVAGAATASRTGDEVTVRVEGAIRNWSVRIAGVSDMAVVSGELRDAAGYPTAGSESVVLRLGIG